MEPLTAHMQAASAATGKIVTKSDEFYGGKLSTLGTSEAAQLLGYLSQHGYWAEVSAGRFGGIYLRVRKCG